MGNIGPPLLSWIVVLGPGGRDPAASCIQPRCRPQSLFDRPRHGTGPRPRPWHGQAPRPPCRAPWTGCPRPPSVRRPGPSTGPSGAPSPPPVAVPADPMAVTCRSC